MKTTRRLADCRPNDIVEITQNPGVRWKVELLRDTQSKNGSVEPDTLRRHPERLRSRYMVRLRNLKSGRLKCLWFCEYINATIHGDSVCGKYKLTDHMIHRIESRNIPRDDMIKVIQYGKRHNTKSGNVRYEITSDLVKHFPEWGRLAGINVICNQDTNDIITAFRNN